MYGFLVLLEIKEAKTGDFQAKIDEDRTFDGR